ncbi:MAG: SIS domain-containing protein [Halobacteriovoraceae bacterium]|jgi:D-sedoheptulose 7-phosphate isomerase|nr:SIS domain-containing protein [Halobacteriovoraceae bacterium]MBT5093411.1 SIS domain-containing protein [Halobacteriovoraceae bacterium]
MDLQSNLTEKCSSTFAKDYLFRLVKYFEQIDSGNLSALIEALKETSLAGGQVYLMGNGGSAASSTHFANDLYCATRNTPYPLKAQSLVDNQSLITALANDQGFENVFKIQLESYLQANDLVIALSASGNSTNLVRGIEFANSIGAKSFSIVGFDGGLLKELSSQSIHIKTPVGDYGPVEDIHLVINHLIADYFKALRIH